MVDGILNTTKTHHSVSDTVANGPNHEIIGMGTVILYINRPGGTSTVNFYGSVNGIDFVPITGTNLNGGATAVTTTGGDIAVAAFTVVAATDVVTTGSAHGLIDNSPVRFNSADTLPLGLTNDATYYVDVTGADTFTVHTATPVSAANKVDIEDTGVGIHTVYTNGELWRFDVRGLKYFRARLAAIANTKLTAYSVAMM